MLGCAAPKKVNRPLKSVSDLPKGNAPASLSLTHFPDRLHAYLWRNWALVPTERLAAVVGATRKEVLQLGQAMNLPKPPHITADQQRRSYITVIKRNWHLLPYEQLLRLLDWTPEQLAYTLREDDFLFLKLGSHKPKCEPLKFVHTDEKSRQSERNLARIVREEFPDGLDQSSEPLFHFVEALSQKPSDADRPPSPSKISPRFCYSYFALYGDPLLETEADPYPEGYLARLAQSGVDGVWLQGVLAKLAPFPWDLKLSARHEERLKNLRALVARARKHGIGVYLYLNEPRSLPLNFFAAHPELKGVAEGDHAALCTSDPTVQKYLTGAIASLCQAVPDLAGFFTITGSENLTNCWSHGAGAKCPRCNQRSPGEVIAEVNSLFFQGIQKSGSQAQLIVWDWGWADAWAESIINRLPSEAALMSVSEWSLPLERGEVKTSVGEYSISAVGPGPRAQRHWAFARKRGLKTIAKIQAGNTWELSAVPYIPAVANVARHAANLREAKVDGLMLGWTLGGYPSPNLAVVDAIEEAARDHRKSSASALAEHALNIVAQRRFGATLAPLVVQAWREFSTAFSEFPFHIGLVYSAPLQVGPANLLWAQPTHYPASMVGFPYDDLDTWRAVYPAEIFISQLEKVADGFDRAIHLLKASTATVRLKKSERLALAGELNVAETCAIHFRSTASQARFVLARRALAAAQNSGDAASAIALIEGVFKIEIALAKRLYMIQSRDSRIGFEASNQYYYVPLDLVEKVLNCRELLERWLPAQRAKWKLS